MQEVLKEKNYNMQHSLLFQTHNQHVFLLKYLTFYKRGAFKAFGDFSL